MSKFLKAIAATVDVLLIIDLSIDLIRKYRARKANVPTDEEPEPAIVNDDGDDE